MNTWFVYWRVEDYQTILYGFPRPGHEPPVLAKMDFEIDCPEARAILVDQLRKQCSVKILVLEEGGTNHERR